MNGTVADTHWAVFKHVSETEWINTKHYWPPRGSRVKVYLGPPNHKNNSLKKKSYKTTTKRNIYACFLAWGPSAFGVSSSPPQARRFHTAAASGALRTAPNAHFCHQFNCKLMALQKFFENPKVPFCAECMLICNLNEILNFTWNMLKKRFFFLKTIVVWYELNLTRQMLMMRLSLLESSYDTVILTQGIGMCKKCGSHNFLATSLAPAPAAPQQFVLCKSPTPILELLLLLKTHHYIWYKACLSKMFDLENET